MLDEYLPEDIVYSILDRIPKKYLLRFQCVSKHSHRLISDFINSKSRRMILLNEQQPFEVINEHDNAILTVSPPCRIQQYYGDRNRIIGTLNGIVVMINAFDGDIILYYPFTGAVKNIPDTSCHDHSSRNFYAYGFGYGTTADDLKIVMIHGSSNGYGSYSTTNFCDVFSLKTRSWNAISNLNSVYYFDGNYNDSVFVNGYLYWMVHDCRRRGVILALDLKNMIFSEIEFPCAQVKTCYLGTFKGSLCAICLQTNNPKYELWVIKGHGLKKSWSKVCSLTSLLEEKCISTFHRWNMLMCILDEGKIVMDKNGDVIIYDMLNDSHKKVQTLTSRHYGLQAIEYVESCASLSL
ncbi:F-box domain-containing protein [Artemisia annua]|uniref:F-box domain-containing protein n=1 Tax=Artemisia annua TaxID=35608 RepID=A0A2U1M9M7_ARTAN|nr:F-box domain-containing protein [Artemisia annua]